MRNHPNKNVLQMHVIMIDFVHIKNNLALIINFQVFFGRKENKMELIQYIKHDENEENGWYKSLWTIVNNSL